MDTGKKKFIETPDLKEGSQRGNSLQKAIELLPERSKDNFLLLSLLLLGISGFAYIILAPAGQKANKRSLYDKIFNPIEKKSLTADTLPSELLKIEGESKINMPMIFNFNKLSSFEGYKIDFGDKIITNIQSSQFNHLYSKPGTYKVELLKDINGNEIVMHCEFLVIN